MTKLQELLVTDRSVPQMSLQGISALVIGLRLCRQLVGSLLSYDNKFIVESCLTDPLENEPKIINKIVAINTIVMCSLTHVMSNTYLLATGFCLINHLQAILQIHKI